MSSDLTIGRVARAAGVNVETIRYYQRLRLIEEPQKPPGGVRRYREDAIARVRFIKRAQELGFSLAEIARLLALEKAQSCGAARSLAAAKLALVDSRLADLARLRAVLDDLIARCDVRGGKVACPIIESLTSGAMPPRAAQARRGRARRGAGPRDARVGRHAA